MKHQSEQVNKTISQEINTLNTKEKERQKKSQTDTKNKGNLSDDLFRKNSNTPTNSYENKIQDERQLQDQKWLKEVFAQTVNDIETTGNQDTALQKTRNISLKIKSMGSFDLQSYGNRTMIDINKGQLTVATKT